MGRPIFYELCDRDLQLGVVLYPGECDRLRHAHIGLSYRTAVEDRNLGVLAHQRLHLMFNMSALWSLGAVERLTDLGLRFRFYLVLVVMSGIVVLGMNVSRPDQPIQGRVLPEGHGCWLLLRTCMPCPLHVTFGRTSLKLSENTA